MAVEARKHVKSKYVGVSGTRKGKYIYWRAISCGIQKGGYKTEREAAKSVDMILIKKGKDPVNIMKKV